MPGKSGHGFGRLAEKDFGILGTSSRYRDEAFSDISAGLDMVIWVELIFLLKQQIT